MRHAAPRNNTLGRHLTRTTELIVAAVAYTIAFAGVALAVLGAAFTVWSLWQWLGVN